MKRAPRSLQHHVLYRKYNGQDSEISALLGKCGLNSQAIEACDAVVAVLDGPDVDSGTAAEIGYAHARGKMIIGYRGDFRLAADNIGSTVNLQVEYFIKASGGAIASSLADLTHALQTMSRASTGA